MKFCLKFLANQFIDRDEYVQLIIEKCDIKNEFQQQIFQRITMKMNNSNLNLSECKHIENNNVLIIEFNIKFFYIN